MARLILGPLLRYAGTEDATIWVETDAACRVEVAIEGADACSRRTFAVEGHHYALLHCTGLAPDSTAPYEVRLDGERVPAARVGALDRDVDAARLVRLDPDRRVLAARVAQQRAEDQPGH